MSVKILSGKIGSGKTTYAINEFADAVNSNKGAFSEETCYFVVPEQFCVEVEDKILDKTAGLVKSEIISFNRLIYRILGEIYPELGEPLSLSGKAMLLSDIANKLNDKLIYFKDAFEKPAKIEKLLETLTELQKYNFTPSVLNDLADKTDGENNKIKIRELAVFLEEYNKLFTNKYVDLQLHYEEAAKYIEEGKTSISKSRIWIDSFSGFTKNELVVIKAIAKSAISLTICMSRDERLSFSMATVNNTYSDIVKIFKENDILFENVETGDKYSRFKDGSSLKYLSENYEKYIPKNQSKDKKIKADDSIKLVSCKSFNDECENAAAEIKTLVDEGYNYSDIAVVIPDIEDNSFVIESIFDANNIKYFIDSKTKISGHPAIRLFNSFLKIVSMNSGTTEIISLLKTGLYTSEREKVDLFENLLIKYGVKNQNGFKRMFEHFSEKKIENEFASEIYDLFYGNNGYCVKAKTCKTVDDVLNLLLDFSKKLSIEKKLEKMANDKGEMFSIVWNSFANIISETSKILGSTKVSGCRKLFSFVQNIFASGISSLKAGNIPTGLNQVIIGNISRSRYSDKKAVIILGANEGKFPSESNDKGFLGDKERQILIDSSVKIGYNSFEKTLLGEYNAFAAVLAASEKLILSYSNIDDKDGELIKAEIVKKIENMFDIITWKFNIKNRDTKKHNFTAEVEEELVKKILGISDIFNTSISRIKDYVDCPYAYMLNNILKLKEREELIVNNLDTGNLFHSLLEISVKHGSKMKDFSSISKDEWKELISEAFIEYSKDNPDDLFKYDGSNKSRLLLDRIVDFAEYEGTVLSKKAAESGFKPVLEEYVFDNDKGTKSIEIDCDGFLLSLGGKIDRIDMRDTADGGQELALIDYKSGDRTISNTKIEKGVLIQLLAYKTAIDRNLEGDLSSFISKEAMIVSLSYYLFGKTATSSSSGKHNYKEAIDKNIKTKGFSNDPSNKRTETFDFVELEKDNIQKIKTAAENISKGDFNGNLNDNDSCKNCKYFDICKKPDRKEQNED